MNDETYTQPLNDAFDPAAATAEQTLADQPAPSAPNPPLQHLTSYPHNGDDPATKRRKKDQQLVRRVGVFTMGISLILVGLIIAVSLFVKIDLLTVAKLCPLVLVALGTEILWANARKGEARLKYDFLSMFVCFLLICTSVVAACVPTALQYWGPERYMAEERLQIDMENKLFDTLGTNAGITSLHAYLHSDTVYLLDENSTLADTPITGWYVEISIDGDYTTADEFATAVEPIVRQLADMGIRSVNINSNGACQWAIYLNGKYSMNQNHQQLADATYLQGYSDEMMNSMMQSSYNAGYAQGSEDCATGRYIEDGDLIVPTTVLLEGTDTMVETQQGYYVEGYIDAVHQHANNQYNPDEPMEPDDAQGLAPMDSAA